MVYVGKEMLSGDSDEAVATPAEVKPVPAVHAEPPKSASPPVREIAKAPVAKPAADSTEMEAGSPRAEPPATEPAAADPAPPATAAAKTSVIIVKPVDVKLRFGSAKLPVGAQLKIVSQDGPHVTVTYGAENVTIPIEATDLATPSPAQ